MSAAPRAQRGRPSAPALPASLGVDVRVIQTSAFVPGRMAVPVTITRQVLDIDEDRDYDAEQHRPSASRLASLERTDLATADLHEDPYAETGRLIMRPAPGEMDAFRAYVNDNRFRANIERFSRTPAEIAERAERARAGCETTEAGASVRNAMRAAEAVGGQPIIDRLTAATALPPAAAERDRWLPPATPTEVDRIAIANMQTLNASDAARLLADDFLPGLGAAERDAFLTMPCANTIVRRVWPLLAVPEQRRRHYNVVELVEHMVAAGCKYHSVVRAETRERLGEMLDPERHDIRVDHSRGAVRTLRGGHEHYDTRNRRTRFVVFHFYCVLRPKQSTAQQQQQMAERLRGLAAQAEREYAARTTFDPDEDMWDTVGMAPDDDYTGGNDLQDPASHFIYRASLVCVEAVDCVCANEALEPRVATPATTHAARRGVRLDDSVLSSEAPAPPAAPMPAAAGMLPDGLGALTLESATVLVGKYRAATFLANCQGALPFYPLCVRGLQFSAGQPTPS